MNRIAIGLLIVLALAAGCRPAKPVAVDPSAAATAVDTTDPADNMGPADSTAPPGTTAPAVTVVTDRPTIKIGNWEETQQLVAQHAGKVVILDLWASW